MCRCRPTLSRHGLRGMTDRSGEDERNITRRVGHRQLSDMARRNNTRTPCR